MAIGIGRRQFISALGGATVAWPLAARAQQSEHVRLIGVLTATGANDAAQRIYLAAFRQALQKMGWIEGHNVRFDTRFAERSTANLRKYAAELVALTPDVILATSNPSLEQLLQVTRTVPIVFAIAIDPVGSGFVDSLSRPGGNATGFMMFEYSLCGKWVELLKQIEPSITRVAVLRDPTITQAIGEFAVIQSVAPSFNVEVIPVDVRDKAEIERALEAFGRSANGGLILTTSPGSVTHSDLVATLATRHKLPAVSFERFFVAAGGLASYGPNLVNQFALAAGYVDRILRGEKPTDLPVQAPTKYELVINLKTAKALGLDIPVTVLARADEVIE